jgi:hypothetical protein
MISGALTVFFIFQLVELKESERIFWKTKI